MKNKKIFYVSGMHCASCEIFVEEKIRQLKKISSVNVSSSSNTVTIESDDDKINSNRLNDLFKGTDYSFSDKAQNKGNNKNIAFFVLLSAVIISFVIIYPKLNFSIDINQNSSLISFFGFGLLAGFSTCAILLGSLLISISKRWGNIKDGRSFYPGVMFNLGRILGFAIGGGLLGVLGSYVLKIATIAPFITILVSILIIISALGIIGIKVSLPKIKILNKIFSLDESMKISRFEPFIIGILSFFIPCGFTFTAQMFALQSGSLIRGSLILLFFALGTVIPLFLISVFGQRLAKGGSLIKIVSKIVGIILIAFSVWNIYSQTSLLIGRLEVPTAFNNPSVLSGDDNKIADSNDIAIIQMKVTRSGFSPNKFTVREGEKVRFEITNEFGGGCTNSIIASSLWKGEVDLPYQKTVTKEFVAPKAGSYRFSCWMGMVNGKIEVIK